jgi:hypothetical protein
MTAETQEKGRGLPRRKIILGSIAGLLLAANAGALVCRALFRKETKPVTVAGFRPPRRVNSQLPFDITREPVELDERKLRSIPISLAGPFLPEQLLSTKTSLSSWLAISSLGFESCGTGDYFGATFRCTEEENPFRQVHVIVKIVVKNGKTHRLFDRTYVDPRPRPNYMGGIMGTSFEVPLPVKLTEIKHLDVQFNEEKSNR